MPIVVQHSPTALQATLAQNIGQYNTLGTNQQRAIQQAGFLLDQNRANQQLQLQQQGQANEMQRFNQQIAQTAKEADLNRQFQASQSQNELGARLSQEQLQRDFQGQQQQNQLGYDVGRSNQQDQLQRDLEQTRLQAEQTRQQNLFEMQDNKFRNDSALLAEKNQALDTARQTAHDRVDSDPSLTPEEKITRHTNIDLGAKTIGGPSFAEWKQRNDAVNAAAAGRQNSSQIFTASQKDADRAAATARQGDVSTREGQRTASAQALRLQQQISGIYDPKINYLNSQLHQLTAQLRTVFESGKRDALLGQIAQVSDQLRQAADAKSAAIQAIGQQAGAQNPAAQPAAPTSQPAAQGSGSGGQLWSQNVGRFMTLQEVQAAATNKNIPLQQAISLLGIDPNDVQ